MGSSIPRRMLIGFALTSTLLVVPLGFGSVPASPNISVAGSIASGSTTKDGWLQFTLTVANMSSLALGPVQLIGIPDGYQLQQIYVGEGPTLLCDRNCARSSLLLAKSVAPGQSFIAKGYLKATSTHKPEKLSLLVGWNPPKIGDSRASSVVVDLGENEVKTGWQRVYEFFKDFGTAIVIGLAGFYFQWLMKRKEARAETWKLMLPVSHNYATKYYLPLSVAAMKLATALEDYLDLEKYAKWPEEKRAEHELWSFYCLLLVETRMAKTILEISGFFFKDLTGEKLAVACREEYVDTFLGEEKEKFNMTIKDCLKSIKPDDTFQEFTKIWSRSTCFLSWNCALQKGFMLFQGKLKNKDATQDAALSLEGLSSILDYEANRHYEFWYDKYWFQSRSLSGMQISEGGEVLLRKLALKAKLSYLDRWRYFRYVSKPD